MEHELIEERGCCKGGKGHKCCPGKIIQLLLTLLTFIGVLYLAIMLPKIVRSEVSREPALKAGGVENYERILSEVYDTPEYKQMMTEQLEQALVQNKAMMEMYSQQGTIEDPAVEPAVEPTTGDEVVSGDVTADVAPVEPTADPAASTSELSQN